MAVKIDVDYGDLDRAKAAWHAHAETLDAAHRRMAQVSTARLSAAVAAEVSRFAHVWHTEVGLLAAQAQDNADAFVYAKFTYLISDRAQAERIRSLLPWGQRHDAIR